MLGQGRYLLLSFSYRHRLVLYLVVKLQCEDDPDRPPVHPTRIRAQAHELHEPGTVVRTLYKYVVQYVVRTLYKYVVQYVGCPYYIQTELRIRMHF